MRVIQLAAEAYNRRDLDAVVIGYDPDFEYYQGTPTGRRRARQEAPAPTDPRATEAYVAEAAEVWGTETRFEPTEFVDMGEQLVVLAEAPMREPAQWRPLIRSSRMSRR